MLKNKIMPNLSFDLKEKLETAWLYRTNQQLTECRQLFSEISSSLGLELRVLSERIFVGLTPNETLLLCDFVLLAASLFRIDAKLEESEKLIQLVAKELSARSLPLPFQLYFQKGNNCFFVADYSKGLELFLMARGCAGSLMEKVITQGNIVYCLENLALPYENALAELNTLFVQAAPSDFPDLRRQYKAMQMRSRFHRGNFSAIFELPSTEDVSHPLHLRYWISELPYHRFFGAFSNLEKENYLLNNPSPYQKTYRLRTMEGIIHPSDQERFWESDFSDRLYLWVWRWLTGPEAFPIEKVMALLEDVSLKAISPKLTTEDCQMVHNALLWIALFVPREAAELRRLAWFLCPQRAAVYPLFEIEGLLIDYFEKLQAGETGARDTLAKLKSHFLWNNDELMLGALVRFVAGEIGDESLLEPLRGLAQRLKQLCSPSRKLAKHHLYIDLASYRVQWNEGRQ